MPVIRRSARMRFRSPEIGPPAGFACGICDKTFHHLQRQFAQ
jgi:hypothetical protein